jgi:transcriptional regulator of acetoin/glycerol metabolism
MSEDAWTDVLSALGYNNDYEALCDLYTNKGFTQEEIARLLGVSRSSVYFRMRMLGVERRNRGGCHGANSDRS